MTLTKNSAYDYVNLNRLKSLPERIASKEAVEKRPGIVFSNGFFVKEASQIEEGLVVLPLSEAINTYGGVLNRRLDAPEADHFAHLNRHMYEEGVFIYVPPKSAFSLNLTQVISGTALMPPRIHLFLGAQSALNLSISYDIKKAKAPLLTEVIDCALSEESSLNLRCDARGFPEEMTHFVTTRAFLKRGSRFSSVNATHGSKTTRFDYAIELQQEEASATLKGLTHLFDSREAHTNVLMTHKAPHCTSSQTFKTLLEDTTSSSFQGKIYVHKEALKTEAFQLNQNLLLDERARAYCKPNLEIFADDVKASHGATFGALDSEQLFYMKARGFSTEDAKNLLIKSFCDEIWS